MARAACQDSVLRGAYLNLPKAGAVQPVPLANQSPARLWAGSRPLARSTFGPLSRFQYCSLALVGLDPSLVWTDARSVFLNSLSMVHCRQIRT